MRNKILVIGVDPGAKGGMAAVTYIMDTAYPDTVEKVVRVIPFNENDYIRMMLDNSLRSNIFYIEKVNAMPNQGVTSMFNFGKNFGWIIGAAEATGYGVHYVRPQEWKKYFGLIGTDKQASIAKCKELYPDVDLKRTERCKTDSDGMAEAILIATYGVEEMIRLYEGKATTR